MDPLPDILTSNQRDVLENCAREAYIRERFYLTGGTALAGYYLGHRLSEDLDFFSEQEIDMAALTVFIERMKRALHFSVDYQQSYNRNLFFLRYGDGNIVKTEFTYFPFVRIDALQKTTYGLPLDSALDIAVNKLFTIYQQARARDYIDLYCLIERYHWGLDELTGHAIIKFDWHIDPLQLGVQFLKAEAATDLPRMKTPLPEKQWRQFFLEAARKLKDKIIDA